MSGRVDLHLRIRVSREKREAFDAFLRDAISFYESPGGIRVRLIENEQDPTDLIEVIEYASVERYEADRRRAATDPQMHDRLVHWRTLLDGRPEVIAYFEKPFPASASPVPVGFRLGTDRLVLRPLVLSDADAVAALAADRRVAEMTLTLPYPYERQHAITWIDSLNSQRRDGTAAIFAVCEAGGPLVGAIGLEISKAHERAELGYWIGVPYWGRGYATEASIELIRYGFETFRLNRIFAAHYACNPASGRVLEKCGLKHEGVARQHIKRMGVIQDSVMYGISRAEWEAARLARPMK